jgi:hypothetical protein
MLYATRIVFLDCLVVLLDRGVCYRGCVGCFGPLVVYIMRPVMFINHTQHPARR